MGVRIIAVRAAITLLIATSVVSTGFTSSPAIAVDPFFYREHPTANHEKVWIRDIRDEWIEDDHNITFAVLERVVSWARSPRCYTSTKGIDRAAYKYRVYEYETRDGDPVKTGRWVVVKAIIEWGDGREDEGWLVTAYPVSTNSGPPATKDGKSWAPNWMRNSLAIGPVNNDIICN